MSALNISDTAGLQCEVQIPGPTDSAREFVDRWSDANVELPAAVVMPNTEQDVIDAIRLAGDKDLCVVAAGGKHGDFVPITRKTLYLDLKKLDAVVLDRDAETVTVGGGVTTGRALQKLSEAGYYTSLPNGNEVGVVGAFLGGGGGNFNSVRGFLIDQAVSVRIVTAVGKTLVLSPNSEGEEGRLWDVLRGAGHGLGVITELTVKMFPITGLNMTQNKAWVRRTVFPASAIDVAAKTYEKLQPVRGPITALLLFVCSPPASPNPGAPMILLLVTYFGPSEEAEEILKPLFAAEVVDCAVVKTTELVDLKDSNNAAAAMNKHGGFKAIDSAFLSQIDAGTIKMAFGKFVALGEQLPDAYPTAWMAASWDTATLVQNGATKFGSGNATGFFEPRDRGVCVYQFAWHTLKDSVGAVNDYIQEQTKVAMEKEKGPMRRFANNIRWPARLDETYSGDNIREIKRVKGIWDPEGVFWGPLMDAV